MFIWGQKILEFCICACGAERLGAASRAQAGVPGNPGRIPAAGRGPGSRSCPGMLRACLWPSRDGRARGAAATPATASHAPPSAPGPQLLRPHNAPIVHGSARLPPKRAAQSEGRARARVPGCSLRGNTERSDPQVTAREPESPSPGILGSDRGDARERRPRAHRVFFSPSYELLVLCATSPPLHFQPSVALGYVANSFLGADFILKLALDFLLRMLIKLQTMLCW